MARVLETVILVLPLLATLAGVLLVLGAAHWLLLGRHPELGNERKLPRQVVMLALTLAGLVAIALALPLSDSIRNQAVALIGLLVSGVFAFSSTTIVANLMAGIMLRATTPFRTGDFIQIEQHFGRIVERGLLDTEIQTEHRELVSLPNLYMISHPVTVLRSSGTIVSCTLSLGYDVHHARVEPLLIAAANEVGLEDPFTQVLELGNYAITYRVCGLLADVKNVISTRSRLHRAVLDSLHGGGIEIVSPTFMNQRRVPEGVSIVPQPVAAPAPPVATTPEEIVFDKAEEAQRREETRERLRRELQELEHDAREAQGDEKQALVSQIVQTRLQLQALDAVPNGEEEPGGSEAVEPPEAEPRSRG